MHAIGRPETLGFDPARLGRIRDWMEGYVDGGRFPFACTVFWIDPVEDMTVLFLTQLSPSHSTPYRKELRALVYQALVD